jgi:tRNA dimethylallyltransferase
MSRDHVPVAVFLMGPTAAGKTELALTLHEHLPVELISVDSSQVYRGMDVGTAKPTPAQLARATHRLIDIRDPTQSYSAAEFRADASREMEEVWRSGRIPLLVGGTMLYFHALEYGLSLLPSADAMLRHTLEEQARQVGWPELHRRLQALDPEAARRIHPHDAQRIQRALEIIELTGKPATYWYARTPRVSIACRLVRVGIYPRKRSELHERIRVRFRHMLSLGLVAEVERLRERYDIGPELPSMRTVGYRQVWEYLTGQVNYNEMIERGVAATRQLAKRQLTWLRSYREVHSLDSTDRGLAASCLGYLSAKLDATGV